MSRPSIRIVCYCIVVMMVAAAIPALAGLSKVGVEVDPQDLVVVLSDNFDDGSISDWVTDTSGGSVALSGNHFVTPKYSMGLEKLPVKKTCSASHALGSLPNTNKRLYLDVDMMSWSSGGWTDLYLNLMSGNKDMLTLAFHWSGIEWFDGDWHYISSFSPSSVGYGDMWYHVKIVADLNAGTFDIHVTDGNGHRSGTALGVPFGGAPHAIDTVWFQAGWGMMDDGAGEAFWVDNLLIRA